MNEFEWVRDFLREPTEADLASALYKIADSKKGPGDIIELSGPEMAALQKYQRERYLTARTILQRLNS